LAKLNAKYGEARPQEERKIGASSTKLASESPEGRRWLGLKRIVLATCPFASFNTTAKACCDSLRGTRISCKNSKDP
jgi:hypothetical protein